MVKYMEINMLQTGKNPSSHLLSLGELLIDMIPGTEGMRIAEAGPVIKTASGDAALRKGR